MRIIENYEMRFMCKLYFLSRLIDAVFLSTLQIILSGQIYF